MERGLCVGSRQTCPHSAQAYTGNGLVAANGSRSVSGDLQLGQGGPDASAGGIAHLLETNQMSWILPYEPARRQFGMALIGYLESGLGPVLRSSGRSRDLSSLVSSGATTSRFVSGSAVSSRRQMWHRYLAPGRGVGSNSLCRIGRRHAGQRQGIAPEIIEKSRAAINSRRRTTLAGRACPEIRGHGSTLLTGPRDTCERWHLRPARSSRRQRPATSSSITARRSASRCTRPDVSRRPFL
jgi:hypothetical protein